MIIRTKINYFKPDETTAFCLWLAAVKESDYEYIFLYCSRAISIWKEFWVPISEYIEVDSTRNKQE